jgi:hypothetical protein
MEPSLPVVIAGLGPGIHDFPRKDVDGRAEPGHDGEFQPQ